MYFKMKIFSDDPMRALNEQWFHTLKKKYKLRYKIEK